MKKLFLLIKEDINFSKEEVLSLYKPDNHELIEDLLFFNTNIEESSSHEEKNLFSAQKLKTSDASKTNVKDFSNRLALTKKTYNLIEISKDVELSVEKIDWNKIIKGSYKVRCDEISLEKKLANIIYETLDSPKVDLKNPDSYIQIFIRNETFFICILDKIVSTSWKKRLPHMKPELSPTSLNPRLGISMINLAGKPKGILCDPFCGTGGILVESGLLKHKLIGFDIDLISIKKAKINLDYYKIKNYDLFNEDALTNNESFDFVVTDLPYGLNTKVSNDLEPLYKSFFEKYYSLCDVMIVGLPDFIDYKNLIGKWKIEKEFTIYLHKSLSKKILKLKR